MFCLLADLEIRKRTGNRFGLQDAMRGVIAAGGNHEQDWSIERVLSTADKAVGVDVLTRLHNEMGSKPVTPDLAALWRDLGLKSQGDDLEFDDTAPLVRRSARPSRSREPNGGHRHRRRTLLTRFAAPDAHSAVLPDRCSHHVSRETAVAPSLTSPAFRR